MSDNQTLSVRVAEEIRVLLVRRRTSARQLAMQTGMSQSAMSARLTGNTPIDLDELQKIADALEVPITALLPAKQETKRRSVPAAEPVPTPTRTAELTLGRGTPTLDDPPSMTPIVRPTSQLADDSRNRRPVRLSTAGADGGAR